VSPRKRREAEAPDFAVIKKRHGMTQEYAVQRLARWVVALRYEDLPPQVLHHAKRAMLDTLGVQIRGAILPWVQPGYLYARSIGGNDVATITYHGDKVHAPYAAYANSGFSYSCELQHHGSPGSAHTGAIVGPVIQALGELYDSSGKEIITAMVAGYEAQGQVGAALYQPQYHRHHNPRERHFHLQGMMAPFSAAAAAGKLMGLNEEEQTHAFAIAANLASGVLEYDEGGGEEKRLHGAMGARSGIQACIQARFGLTGPLSIFEGRHGYFAAFGGNKPRETLFTELGREYCITQCRYRIYSCIGCSHSPIDITADLMKKHDFHYRDVEKVRVGLYERGMMHTGSIRRPHDMMSAHASLPYSVALRLVKGSNSLETYHDPDLWRDPEVLAVTDRVDTHAVVKEGFPRYTIVEIKLRNGRTLAGELDYTPGQVEAPFSDELIEEKFRDLVKPVLPRDRIEALMETISRLETLKSMRELVPLLLKKP
jgi:2-methylcitrate dehydratase PrpD